MSKKNERNTMKLRNITLISTILAVVLMSGCSTKRDKYLLFQDPHHQITNQTESQFATSSQRGVYEYKIVPNNRLSILVYNHPELSTRDVRAQVAPRDERGVLVARDGTVDLPLLGVVRVAGLTAREASNLLSKEYAKYIRNSHVNVEVLNKRVFVIGEVRRPGKVDIIEDTSNLLEALANAGDMTDFAERNSIKIIRGTMEKPIVETVDLTKITALNPAKLTLYPNDVVYVQPNAERRKNLSIAETLPGIDIVGRVLSTLFTGKQLTNTRVFDINSYQDYIGR